MGPAAQDIGTRMLASAGASQYHDAYGTLLPTSCRRRLLRASFGLPFRGRGAAERLRALRLIRRIYPSANSPSLRRALPRGTGAARRPEPA